MKYAFLLMVGLSIQLISCTDNDIDETYPEIDLNILGGFPKNCDTIYRGQSFQFKAEFSDNVALGSYSLEIHNNFDHHTHSTEADPCPYDPDKDAINPWLYLEQFSIPAGSSQITASQIIEVPSDVDPGDYHFQIRLTDHEGWQRLKGLSIKIME